MKINPIEISKPEELIFELEKLRQLNMPYIFRGQHNSEFKLIPSAFRKDVIDKRFQEYSLVSNCNDWLTREKTRDIVKLLSKQDIDHFHIQRIYELALYIMQHNYYLANHVKNDTDNFNIATVEMYQLRPPSFWIEYRHFLDFFYYLLDRSIGRITIADSKIINYSEINEEMASYDQSLPQHYGTETTALDLTLNPLKAIFFAIRDIPNSASHFSVFAYRELDSSKKNPIAVHHGHPGCKNPRIKLQEGLFISLKYACLYYFMNKEWPTVETFLPLSQNTFELIKFRTPISIAGDLDRILKDKGITGKTLGIE